MAEWISKDIGKLKEWASLLGAAEFKDAFSLALWSEYARLFDLHARVMTDIGEALEAVLGSSERTDATVPA